jgi:hypothetical protein
MEQSLDALLKTTVVPFTEVDLGRTKLLTIQQFCIWAGISLSQFQTLDREGRGPAVIVLSRMIRRISLAEAEAWADRLSHPTGKELARQQLEKNRCRMHAKAAGRKAAESPKFVSTVRRAQAAE